LRVLQKVAGDLADRQGAIAHGALHQSGETPEWRPRLRHTPGFHVRSNRQAGGVKVQLMPRGWINQPAKRNAQFLLGAA
jgi:hypothetical protein